MGRRTGCRSSADRSFRVREADGSIPSTPTNLDIFDFSGHIPYNFSPMFRTKEALTTSKDLISVSAGDLERNRRQLFEKTKSDLKKISEFLLNLGLFPQVKKLYYFPPNSHGPVVHIEKVVSLLDIGCTHPNKRGKYFLTPGGDIFEYEILDILDDQKNPIPSIGHNDFLRGEEYLTAAHFAFEALDRVLYNSAKNTKNA